MVAEEKRVRIGSGLRAQLSGRSSVLSMQNVLQASQPARPSGSDSSERMAEAKQCEEQVCGLHSPSRRAEVAGTANQTSEMLHA